MGINWHFEKTRFDSGGDASALNFKRSIEDLKRRFTKCN